MIVCGIGAMRSTCAGVLNASTALVPRMNITAMIGAAMSVARPIVRSGLRHSPASTATYSKPLNAPTASLPKMFKLKRLSAGIASAKG